MFIRVERGSSVPISRQITEQIRAQCLSGTLSAGTALPSVRQLAGQLAVNVNTVVRVYERLAAEGLVEMRHGDGTYVRPQDASRGRTEEIRRQREQFQRDFGAIVRRGAMLGISAREMRSMLTDVVSEATSELNPPRREKPTRTSGRQES